MSAGAGRPGYGEPGYRGGYGEVVQRKDDPGGLPQGSDPAKRSGDGGDGSTPYPPGPYDDLDRGRRK